MCSSPSFGSYQICSCSKPLSETQVRLLLLQLILSFLMRSGFSTLTLAYWIDSLVRVSRRDGKSHFDKIARRPLKPSSGFAGYLPTRRLEASNQFIPDPKLHFVSCMLSRPYLGHLISKAYEVLTQIKDLRSAQ